MEASDYVSVILLALFLIGLGVLPLPWQSFIDGIANFRAALQGRSPVPVSRMDVEPRRQLWPVFCGVLILLLTLLEWTAR